MGNRSRIRLGARDLDLLQYVGEQRMSWLLAIHQKFYRNKRIDAAKSTIRRLLGPAPKYRYLQPYPLDGKRVYYCLTRRAARLFGFSYRTTSSLGYTALIRRYAVQWFIEVDGQDERWLCQPSDYPELFPARCKKLPRANYYLQNSGESTELGIALEDYGSDARRVVRRAIDLLDRLLQNGWFDDLIIANRFAISFLTMSTTKAHSIERHFERLCERHLSRRLNQLSPRRPGRITADYVVVPGLIDVIPTRQYNKERGKNEV